MNNELKDKVITGLFIGGALLIVIMTSYFLHANKVPAPSVFPPAGPSVVVPVVKDKPVVAKRPSHRPSQPHKIKPGKPLTSCS